MAGERLRVTATAPRLEVAVAIYTMGADGRSLVDDGGGWTPDDEWSAFAGATLPTSGQYIICVHSHRPETVGEYDVYVTSARTPRPAEPATAGACFAQGDPSAWGGLLAGNADWFINNEEITVNNRAYVKYGLPRVLTAAAVIKFASFRNVGIYVAPNAQAMRPGMIYVAVRGCEFQPYVER